MKIVCVSAHNSHNFKKCSCFPEGSVHKKCLHKQERIIWYEYILCFIDERLTLKHNLTDTFPAVPQEVACTCNISTYWLLYVS
jgi:hypothetical protein